MSILLGSISLSGFLSRLACLSGWDWSVLAMRPLRVKNLLAHLLILREPFASQVFFLRVLGLAYFHANSLLCQRAER